MDLNQYAQTSPALHNLLQQSRHFLALDKEIKTLLPANLTAHFRVSCVRNGVLVLVANNAMVASRLKMMLPAILSQIQDFNDEIGKIEVKMLPENPPAPHEKQCLLSDNVVAMFERTAEQIHHNTPELAQALRDLVAKHK